MSQPTTKAAQPSPQDLEQARQIIREAQNAFFPARGPRSVDAMAWNILRDASDYLRKQKGGAA